MNGKKMSNEINYKGDISPSYKGIIDTKKKSSIKNLTSFTPSPLKKETYLLSNSTSANVDHKIYLRNNDKFLLEPDGEDNNFEYDIVEDEGNKVKALKTENFNLSPNNAYRFSNPNNIDFDNKKNKEKKEGKENLADKCKNFLENYDNLLGMMISSSKASTMNSSSNDNSEFGINIREHAKSRTTKYSQPLTYPKITNFNDDEEENQKEDRKFKFSTSFKSKKSSDLVNIPRSRKSTGDAFLSGPIILRKNQNDVSIPQSKKSKEIESGLFKMNPIEEEDKNNYESEKKIFDMHPTNTDHSNENEQERNETEENCNYSYSKENEDNGSTIKLQPMITNVKKEVDNLVTSIKKINQDDRNVEETKAVQTLTNTEEIKDFYEYTEECLKRIIKLKVPTITEINDLLFNLPFENELKTKKLAIFDLDETLVHCEIKKPSRGQVQLMVNLPSGDKAKIGLNIRPFWVECLREISKYYLIIVYTASHKSYADSVLDYLDPNKDLIKYRLYRHNCVKVQMESEFIYVKDLRIFKNVRMEDMIIIDNSVLSFAFQLENGIPILPFYDNKDDIELKFLANYLNNIYHVDDLRVENNRSIKMLFFLNSVKDKMEGKIHEDVENSTEIDDINRTTENANSMFKINLFSAESNNQNDVSLHTDNPNESSFTNSEISNNDSEVSLQKIPHYDGHSSENSNTEGNLEIGQKKGLKRMNTLQDKLFSTLDDLKKTFSKLSEKKRSIES